MTEEMTTNLIFGLCAYLIGSISSGLVVKKFMGTDDPRGAGSGNIGATNMWRIHSKRAGIITLAGDMLKGLVPIAILKLLNYDAQILNIVAVSLVLGHMFPFYLKFKGGKGVATGFGVMVVLAPIAAFYSACAFLVFTLITRWVSLGSIVAAFSIFFFTAVQPFAREHFIAAFIIGILIILKHGGNIVRLFKGTEPKI